MAKWLLCKSGQMTESVREYYSEEEAYRAYDRAIQGNDWLTLHVAEVKKSLLYTDLRKEGETQ